MKTFIILLGGAITLSPTLTPNLTGMLGLSTYTARRVVDAIMAGAAIWTILSLLLISAGSVAIALATVKFFVKRVGRHAAISW